MSKPTSEIEIINPAAFAPELDRVLRELEQDSVVRRIWDRDWTVWKTEDREISDRLGWLDAPTAAVKEAAEAEAFAAAVRGEGRTHAVVLGMGGSSLAPEVFARSFPTAPGSLELEILDTTEPGTVAAAAARLDLRHTLFLVSSKSGSTTEMVALLSYFHDRVGRVLGTDRAGDSFVAVTDPGSSLEALAGPLRFRRVFHGRPDIGGRFSALSAFGLLPAALKGIDPGRLLAPARHMAGACGIGSPSANPGVLLGAALGAAALGGRDKLSLLIPRSFEPLAGWLEQLIAESTGKEGRGIVPVVESRPGEAGSCGSDRLFVDLLPRPDEPTPERVKALIEGGCPIVRVIPPDPYSLGGYFFLWEFATAVAGRILGINPFDQPDVESTKKKTREILAAAAGISAPAAPEDRTAPGGLRITTPGFPEKPGDAVSRFLAGRRDGDYLAILGFLPRSAAVEEGVARLADRLGRMTRLPVTVGFGPRYLHSTGQLHKGDGNRGLFLMLVATGLPEVGIPDIPGIARPAADFGSLFTAQARGDALALAEKGRRVLAIDLSSPAEIGIASLSALLT